MDLLAPQNLFILERNGIFVDQGSVNCHLLVRLYFVNRFGQGGFAMDFVLEFPEVFIAEHYFAFVLFIAHRHILHVEVLAFPFAYFDLVFVAVEGGNDVLQGKVRRGFIYSVIVVVSVVVEFGVGFLFGLF
jgi:hypothetical protein